MMDVERANRAAGKHWFDADTRRFFGSRIGDNLYGGRFFVSSERKGFDTSARAYSVRVALDDGEIADAGEFLDHVSSGSANRLAAKLAQACRDGRVEVRNDPYDGATNTEPDRRRYEWRPYVMLSDGTAVPIGTRTTHHLAHAAKRQLFGAR